MNIQVIFQLKIDNLKGTEVKSPFQNMLKEILVIDDNPDIRF